MKYNILPKEEMRKKPFPKLQAHTIGSAFYILSSLGAFEG